jgi:hypothetical protein
MQLVIIGVLLVMAMAGAGAAYKTGETNGANGRDLHWKSQIEAANAKAAEDARARKKLEDERDAANAQVLALKKKQDDATNVQATTNIATTPPPPDCTRCNIPGNHYVAWLRSRGTAPNSDPKAPGAKSGSK